MEKSIALLDFETVDQMVQIHGTSSNLVSSFPADVFFLQIMKALLCPVAPKTRRRLRRRHPKFSRIITLSS